MSDKDDREDIVQALQVKADLFGNQDLLLANSRVMMFGIDRQQCYAR